MTRYPLNSGDPGAGGWSRSGWGALPALGKHPYPMERGAAEGKLE